MKRRGDFLDCNSLFVQVLKRGVVPAISQRSTFAQRAPEYTEIAGVDLRSAPSPHRWQVKVYATRRRHSFGGCHKFSRPVTDMCEMMAPVKPCASKLKIVKLNPLSGGNSLER